MIIIVRMREDGHIEVETRVGPVPYFGSGVTLAKALAHLVTVLDDHGAPRLRGKAER